MVKFVLRDELRGEQVVYKVGGAYLPLLCSRPSDCPSICSIVLQPHPLCFSRFYSTLAASIQLQSLLLRLALQHCLWPTEQVEWLRAALLTFLSP